MSKLPHWMQWFLHLCTITGFIFWLVQISNFLKAYT